MICRLMVHTEATNIYLDPADDVDYFKLDLSGQTGDTDVRIYTTGEFDTLGQSDSDSDSDR